MVRVEELDTVKNAPLRSTLLRSGDINQFPCMLSVLSWWCLVLFELGFKDQMRQKNYFFRKQRVTKVIIIFLSSQIHVFIKVWTPITRKLDIYESNDITNWGNLRARTTILSSKILDSSGSISNSIEPGNFKLTPTLLWSLIIWKDCSLTNFYPYLFYLPLGKLDFLL